MVMRFSVRFTSSGSFSEMLAENFHRQWDFDRPDLSEERFRAIVDRAGVDPLVRVEGLTHLARALGLQRRFGEGHETLDLAERDLLVSQSRLSARIKLERGRLFNSAGQPDRSISCFLDAWAMAVRAKADDEAIDAAHMLGIVVGDDEGLAWNRRAFDLALASSDPRGRAWRAPLANNIGWALFDRNDLVGALEVLRQALKFREEARQPAEILIAKWAVARTLRALDRIDDALTIQQALQAELSRAGKTDHYVEEELGECLWAAKKRDEAKPWLRRALEGFRTDEWMVANEAERLARLERFLQE
jgi:tetratricopeptide (TPR) repeat protein